MEILTKISAVFGRQKSTILIITILAFIWACCYCIFGYHSTYKSEASLWIKNLNVTPFITSRHLSENSDLSPLAQAGNPILTQIQILKSGSIEKALNEYVQKNHKKLGIKKEYINLKNSLKIKNKIGTDIIELTFLSSNPASAQKLLEVVVAKYKKTVLETTRDMNSNKKAFIDSQVTTIGQELEAVRSQIKNYKQLNKVVIVKKEAEELAETKKDLVLLLAETRMTKSGLKNEIVDLKKQLGIKGDNTNLIVGFENKTLLSLQDDLNKAIQEKIEKGAMLADTNPKMTAINDKIRFLNYKLQQISGATIQDSLAKTHNINVFDPVKAEAAKSLSKKQAEYISAQMQEKSINTSLANIAVKYKKLPEVEYTLNNLEQQEKNLSLAFDDLKLKQIEVKLNEANVSNSIFDIDTPSLVEKPVPPSRVQYVLICTFLGFLTGVVFSFLRNEFNDYCEDFIEIELITKKPVIGSIPWVKNYKNKDSKTTDLLEIGYKNIVSNLLFGFLKKNRKTIMFTSPFTRTNLGTTVLKIANVLGRQNFKIAFLDNNFRSPNILNQLKITPEYEFSSAITEIQNSILRNGDAGSEIETSKYATKLNKNLHIFANTKPVIDPYEFFTSEAYCAILNQIKKEYDWVFIDTPSGLLPAEFPVIARLSDGVVLLQGAKIKKTQLKHIMKMFETYSLPLIGSIVREGEKEFISRI